MKTKKAIMICLALTALFTSLILSSLLPDFVAALLILGAGCALAYYMAADAQKSRTISELSLLVKAEEKLSACSLSSQVFSCLEAMVKKVSRVEKIEIYPGTAEGRVPDWPEPDGSRLKPETVTAINNWILEHGQSLEIGEGANNNFEQLLSEQQIRSLLVVPVRHEEKISAFLYIYDCLEGIRPGVREITEELAAGAGQVLYRLDRQAETHEIDQTVIAALVKAIDAINPLFAGHSQRVTAAALLIGGKLGLTAEEMTGLKYSSLLHDIGKIKAAGEKEDAGRLLTEHPLQGAGMLPETGFLGLVREGILYHHERYDGEGYPKGLKHNDIPFLARIIAVADVYDALTRLSPEEERLNHRQAVLAVKKATGTLFDPLVVTAFEEVEKEIELIYYKFPQSTTDNVVDTPDKCGGFSKK